MQIDHHRVHDYSIGFADSLDDESLTINSESIEELFITSAKKHIVYEIRNKNWAGNRR